MNKPISYEVTKESNLITNEVTFNIKIKTKPYKNYDGLDLFPDDKIGGLIVAVGRMFDHDKNWSKILRKFKQ